MAEPPVELLVATGNPGKIREFRRLLADLPGVAVRGLSDVPTMAEPIEDGERFEDNATIKAVSAARITGMLTLSDDSGLEVDALGGAPGVYSARYAGEGADDGANNDRLLRELQGVVDAERGARYRVVLALVDPAGPLGLSPHFERGACEGRVVHAPVGDGGFGYDPIFQPAAHDCTMAQLSPEQKSAIDHRGQAVQKMRSFLVDYLKRR